MGPLAAASRPTGGIVLEPLRTGCSRIAAHSGGALVLAKAALRMSERAGMDVGLLYEKELGAVSYTLEGRAESLAAFANRSRGNPGA